MQTEKNSSDASAESSKRGGTSVPTKLFRLHLQVELLRRCKLNPSYSLRAYARSLHIAHSVLSSVLNGKRPLTPKTTMKLGLALGLNPAEILEFRETKKNTDLSSDFASVHVPFQQIDLDTFSVIADWYHYAILELIEVKDFEPNTRWIAKVLGITTAEADISVERLIRVGLLKVDGKKWSDTANGFSSNISPNMSSEASRKQQKQILQLSQAKLERVPISLRDHTSMTMAIHPRDLPEAKRRIAKFRRELCAFLSRYPRKTQVYQLQISLFPLTRIARRIEK